MQRAEFILFAIFADNKFKIKMGKGDRRSKKGKIFRGSFGISRPHKSKSTGDIVAPKEVTDEQLKKAPRKKAAPKKKKEEASE